MARNSNHLDMHSIRNFEVKVHHCSSFVPLSPLPFLRKILTMFPTVSKITKRQVTFHSNFCISLKNKTLNKYYDNSYLRLSEEI